MASAPDLFRRRDFPLNLLAFCLINFAPIAVSALRVPLWARPAGEPESYASALIVVTILASSSLLFPWLFRNVVDVTLVVVVSALLVQLGGVLAGTTIARTCEWAFVVVCGQVSLALLTPLLNGPRSQLVAVACASGVVLGWIALAYLAEEFGTSPTFGITANASAIIAILALCGVLVMRCVTRRRLKTRYPRDVHQP